MGDTFDISGLILKLTDNNNNTIIVDYTNLNDYNITNAPNTKLTINDKIITIQNKTIKTTISIVVTEKITSKKESEIYTPTIENKTIKVNEKIKASDFITNKNKLPKDIKYTFEKDPELNKIGNQEIIVIITYKDNSKDTLSAILTIEDTKQEEKEEEKTPEIEQLPPEEQNPQDEEPKEDNEIINKEELTIKEQNVKEKEQKDSKSNIIYIIFIFVIILLIGIIVSLKFLNKKKETKVIQNENN